MILYQGVGERGTLCDEVRVEILPGEGHTRLSDGRLQGAQVANTSAPATQRKHALVEYKYLAKGEVPHLSETAVELAVLLKDLLRGAVEVFGRCTDKVCDCGGGQVGHRHL
jgi:hypothetical protein